MAGLLPLPRDVRTLSVAIPLLLATLPATPDTTAQLPRCSFLPLQTDAIITTPGAVTDASGRIVRLPLPESNVSRLDVLVRNADTVIVGVARDCAAAERGRQINTVYMLSIETSIKGALQPGVTVPVEFPGGRIETVARVLETRMPGLTPPQAGDRLLLFMKRGAGADAPFSLSQGVWSVFVLQDDDTVQPSFAGTRANSIVTTLRGARTEDVLNQVRTLAAKKR